MSAMGQLETLLCLPLEPDIPWPQVTPAKSHRFVGIDKLRKVTDISEPKSCKVPNGLAQKQAGFVRRWHVWVSSYHLRTRCTVTRRVSCGRALAIPVAVDATLVSGRTRLYNDILRGLGCGV